MGEEEENHSVREHSYSPRPGRNGNFHHKGGQRRRSFPDKRMRGRERNESKRRRMDFYPHRRNSFYNYDSYSDEDSFSGREEELRKHRYSRRGRSKRMRRRGSKKNKRKKNFDS